MYCTLDDAAQKELNRRIDAKVKEWRAECNEQYPWCCHWIASTQDKIDESFNPLDTNLVWFMLQLLFQLQTYLPLPFH